MKYRDRKGNEFTVDTTQDKFLRNLYTSRLGNIFLEFMISPFVTNVIGKFMNSRLSTLKIDGFVHKNKENIAQSACIQITQEFILRSINCKFISFTVSVFHVNS